MALCLGLAAAAALRGQVLYFDTFQQFANGTSLAGVGYTPAAGPYAARATNCVQVGGPALIASNFLGSIRLCTDSRLVPCESRYEAQFAVPQNNQVLVVDWLLWIAATNSGGGAFGVDILTTNAGPQHKPLLGLMDNGLLVMFTNSPVTGLPARQAADLGTPIGNWGQWAGTLMTNRLIMDYPGRAFSLSINGQLAARASIAPYFSTTLDAVRFVFMESSPASLGNCFAIDDVKVTEVPYVRSIEKVGEDIRLSFSTLCSKSYRVEKTEELGTGAWTVLTAGTAGAGGLVKLIDPGAARLPRRFYRVAAFT